MIIAYHQNESGIVASQINKDNSAMIDDAIWLDLISPTKKEEKLAEKHLRLDIPTKLEMTEIELSSRLYIDDENLFMTATMIEKSDSPEPKTDAVTFILTTSKLITVRYIEPHSFLTFITRILKPSKKTYTPVKILLGLLETTTDRLADILEVVTHRFDDISQTIFHTQDDNAGRINYKRVLQDIGTNGDLGTKVRESLVSFNRVLTFLETTCGSGFDEDIKSRLKTVAIDIASLSDYATFISTKVSFLLDATLGMVNIEQNNIIKIFSVAAVVFLPPTLIASIYGMNFKSMPELQWHIGYPLAICFMILSSWLPYTYFKRKKWL